MNAVQLTIVSNELEAAMVLELLKLEGIAGEHLPTDFAVGSTDAAASWAGPRAVFVAASDLERARELLQAGPLAEDDEAG